VASTCFGLSVSGTPEISGTTEFLEASGNTEARVRDSPVSLRNASEPIINTIFGERWRLDSIVVEPPFDVCDCAQLSEFHDLSISTVGIVDRSSDYKNQREVEFQLIQAAVVFDRSARCVSVKR
jgi:hypothetical protein